MYSVGLSRGVSFAAFVGAGLLVSLGHELRGEEPPRKLNVLFIAVDDLNDCVGCYGAPVKTPNIDRLAQMGRRFDRAYCNYPLCNPSRTSLMSGWRPEKTEVWSNGTSPRPHVEGAKLLQEYFHDHGYYTARVGKIYHGAFEDQFKWDGTQKPPRPVPAQRPPRPAATRPAGDGERRGTAARRAARRAAANSPSDGEGGRAGGGPVPITWSATNREDQDEPDGRTSRRIAQILEEVKDRPFFVAAGFAKPHLPWVCPRKYFEMYPPDSIHFVPVPADDLLDIPPIARVPVMPRDPRTDETRKEAMGAYYACTSFVDTQVGVLLEAMDRLKLWDNTVVLFYGDHGFLLGEHGLWRKMSLFEESVRAPLIMVTPRMKDRGQMTREFAEFVDIYPTLLELCGLPPVEGVEGTSLVPLLDNPAKAIKSAAFTVVERDGKLGKSVRTDRYRFTEWPDGSKELYDHEIDPHEFTNLAGKSEMSQKVDELSHVLQAGYRAALLPHS